MNIRINKIARIGGLLYLVIIAAGTYSELFVRSKLIVSGDATRTATNIISSQLLWRTSIAADLVMHICDIPVMLIIYILLKPVSKNLALLALLFNVVQTAVLVINKLNLAVALFPLGSADYLSSFNPHQLYTLTYLSIKSHAYGYGFGLIFFGFTCIVEGYLIFKSGYLPKAIGVLMQIAGLCYLINNFTLIIAPEFSDKLFPVLMAPSFIAELSLCLWLIFKGVRLSVWQKRQEYLIVQQKTSS